ncbi:MAG: DMT family transporter [Dongiaceae bacterium]
MSGASRPALRRPGQAIEAALWMVAASLVFAVMNAAIRYAALRLHPFEVAFFRNLFGLAFLLPWLWQAGLGGLRSGRRWLYGWRALVSLAAMLCSFSALALLPFAQAVALSFTTPLFSTIGAALILRETVRARRWSATIVGFVGVLLMLWPGLGAGLGAGGGSAFGALLGITAAAISAIAQLIVKQLTRTETPGAIASYMVLLLVPMSLPPALAVWDWPAPALWPWLIAIGGLGTLGHLLYVRAFSLADASAVLPYDYVRMPLAALLGWYGFAEVPDGWTMLGSAVIAASALYIAHRERLQARRTTAPAT